MLGSLTAILLAGTLKLRRQALPAPHRRKAACSRARMTSCKREEEDAGGHPVDVTTIGAAVVTAVTLY